MVKKIKEDRTPPASNNLETGIPLSSPLHQPLKNLKRQRLQKLRLIEAAQVFVEAAMKALKCKMLYIWVEGGGSTIVHRSGLSWLHTFLEVACIFR
ncbi:hypothetical protein JHK87_018724 [Glycine soja]|nr:hypothetical protein JHK87_018724 [Glycine soja]